MNSHASHNHCLLTYLSLLLPVLASLALGHRFTTHYHHFPPLISLTSTSQLLFTLLPPLSLFPFSHYCHYSHYLHCLHFSHHFHSFTTTHTFTTFSTSLTAKTCDLVSNGTLTVVLLDVNDNPPTFSSTLLTAEVPSASNPPYNVKTVRADDLDEGRNGQITYSLQEPSLITPGTFSIHNESGTAVHS